MTQAGQDSHGGDERWPRIRPFFLLLLLLFFQFLLWLVMYRAHVRLSIQLAVISFGIVSILGGKAFGEALVNRQMFLSSFEMRAFMAAHREAIVDVAPTLVETICSDFLSEGADVAAVRQTDGQYMVEAVFAQWQPDQTIDE